MELLKPMRLDQIEKEALENAIKNIERDVFLFGSRVDKNRKGGDIDILIFSTENPFTLSKQVSVDFNMKCEGKIDVIVMDPGNLSGEQKAFLNTLTLERIK